MSDDWRKALPAQVKRDVRNEAGWRCAMPRCGQTSSLEIHHIVEHAKGGPDTAENLILLCAVCHGRVTKGEIDQKAIKQIKLNLGLMSARYGELEQRMLLTWAEQGLDHCVAMPALNQIMFMYLVRDGLIVDVSAQLGWGGQVLSPQIVDGRVVGGIEAGTRAWALTPLGKTFVENWKAAKGLGEFDIDD